MRVLLGHIVVVALVCLARLVVALPGSCGDLNTTHFEVSDVVSLKNAIACANGNVGQLVSSRCLQIFIFNVENALNFHSRH